MKGRVTGGQMSFAKLTSEVNEKDYAVRKAVLWIQMLNDNMRPTKWLKATKKGTKVNFETIRSQEDYDKGLDELDTFLYDINKKYGTDFKLKPTAS